MQRHCQRKRERERRSEAAEAARPLVTSAGEKAASAACGGLASVPNWTEKSGASFGRRAAGDNPAPRRKRELSSAAEREPAILMRKSVMVTGDISCAVGVI